MSEHDWTQENVAAYVAGGLDAHEGERIEQHAAACTECAATLRECRGLDRSLETLFADARPAAGLEERAIASLRKASLSPWARLSWGHKLALGTAATVALGVTGAGASHLMNGGELLFPGWNENQLEARNDMRELALAIPKFKNGEVPATNYDAPPTLDPEAMARQVNIITASDLVEKNSEAARETASAKGTPTGSMGSMLSGYINNGNNNGNNNGLGGGLGGIGGGGMMPGGGSALTIRGKYGFGTPEVPIPGGINVTMGDGSVRFVSPPAAVSWDGDASAKRIEPQLTTGQFKPGQTANEFKETSGEGKQTKLQPQFTMGYFEPGKFQASATATPQDKEGKGKEKGASDAPGKSPAPPPDQTSPGQKGEARPVDPKPTQTAPEPAAPRRIVIRSGDIEFEIESFDSAVATVTKLVIGIKGAFVSTVNSDKLPNGKVKGSIVVRVPPDSLDGLVLDLRKELGRGGELKGQRIGSQDITKQYTDLESRLKAAKTMQERLLQIIKEGKGEIKQLLEAEKELGVWRTKIEEFEGEIRYYSNLAALSTLTITLAEKEIRAAVEMVEREQVQAGIEVEDVDKAREQVLTAVADAKGRVVKAELKQHAVGQFNATLNFEVPPAAAGPLQDRLRQIGTVVRFEKERLLQAEGGQATRDAKVRHGDALFLVQLYNVTNMAARETTVLQLAVADVPASYQALQQAVAKAKGRIVTGQLNEQDRQNITAQLDFEVRRGDEGALQTALAAAGEIVARQVTRAVASENTTDAKLAYRATLFNVARIPPRETVTLGIEVTDVDRELDTIRAFVNDAKGRSVDSVVGHERSGKVTARVIYDVPLSAAPDLIEKLKRLGTVRAQQSIRNQQAPEGNLAIARLDVTLANQDLIVSKDDGLWTQTRKGLSYSVQGLLLSVSWLIVGLCVILPWGMVAYGIYRMARRLFRTAPAS